MNTSTVSFRINSELLNQLKLRAKEAHRSMSAELIRLISEKVTPPSPKISFKSEGFFSQFEAPDLNELEKLKTSYINQIKSSKTP